MPGYDRFWLDDESTDSKSTRLNAALGGGKATHMAAFK